MDAIAAAQDVAPSLVSSSIKSLYQFEKMFLTHISFSGKSSALGSVCLSVSSYPLIILLYGSPSQRVLLTALRACCRTSFIRLPSCCRILSCKCKASNSTPHQELRIRFPPSLPKLFSIAHIRASLGAGQGGGGGGGAEGGWARVVSISLGRVLC